ncbi:transthyretin-like family protein [Tenacibaculum agarivorans]|uniref:hypothetical protein n=1 Tax=Tenacibaculum agarivorans TaxID=1908389 RepID=UPI000A8C7D04|nr:hypothetical protein [Tenacibaculum agarivorans]
MKQIKGNLSGYICEDCLESVSNTKVKLYQSTNDDVANSRNSFKLLSEKEIKSKDNFLVGEGFTDESGNYEIELFENYQDGNLEFHFELNTVPKSLHEQGKFPTRQFYAETFLPKWDFDSTQDFELAFHDYIINSKWWCYIRGVLFDAWVICGKLLNCQIGTPIKGATVNAFDADFLSDDSLGSTTTDSNGHFRIDYTSKTFKQTFLSPVINVETDPGLPLRFQSGPDVYFKAELAGATLVDEKKADARKNVNHCLCVTLCSEVNVVDPNDSNFPSAWTGIGSAFNASFGTSTRDFDVDGFAGAGKYALYSVINLTGQAALKSVRGNPIEYRFLVSNVTTPNGSSSPADSNFNRVVGVEPGLFVSREVLRLSRKISLPSNNIISVSSAQADFDANGWFDVNKAIDRTLIANGLTPADLSLFDIIDTDTLISLDTRKLTTASNVTSTISAGQDIPPSEKASVEKFAIRFEIREVINKATNQFNTIPGSGRTLNSVVMNNTSLYKKLSIAELEATTLCTPINGTIHAKYTVYHPYLSYVRLHLESNSGSVDRNIDDGVLPNNTGLVPVSDEVTNASSQLNNPPNDMDRCTYTLELSVNARLHNGNSATTNQKVKQVFFYDI